MNVPAVAIPDNHCFDYGLLEPSEAQALRERAARIRKIVGNHITAVIEAGRELIAVKENLEHGKFCEWLQGECGFSLRTAENYMGAAKFVEGKKNATIAILQLQPATVYKLAAKSTPPEIVESVLERGSRGDVVSDQQVRDALQEVRHQKREADRKNKPKAPSKGQIAHRARLQRKIEEDAAHRLDAAHDAALSIIAELGTEKTKFVLRHLKSLEVDNWDLIAELNKQVGNGAAQ